MTVWRRNLEKVFCMFALCSILLWAAGAGAAGKMSLVFMCQENVPGWMAKKIKDFEKTYPNIEVEVQSMSSEVISERAWAAFAGGTPPDVLWGKLRHQTTLYEAGWLETLDQYVARSGLEELLLGMNLGKYKGVYFGLAVQLWPQVFIYNKKVLGESGLDQPPRTWKEFTEHSLKIMEAGYLYSTVQSWTKYSIPFRFGTVIFAHGGRYFDEDLNPLVNIGGCLEAVTWATKGLRKYKFISSESIAMARGAVKEVFLAGDIAYTISDINTWLQGAKNPEATDHPEDFDLALVPGTDGIVSGTWLGGPGLVMSKVAKNKKAAWELIEWLLTDKTFEQSMVLGGEGNLPVLKSVYTDPLVMARVPCIDMVGKQIEYGYVPTRMPWQAEFEGELGAAVQSAFLERKSPKEAMDGLAKKMIELRERYKK